MKKLSALDWVALVLVVVGALNWGLVGLFDFDLVATLFGDMSTLTRIVYDLVGLAGLWVIKFEEGNSGLCALKLSVQSVPQLSQKKC